MVGGDDPMHSNWKTAGPAYKSLHVPEQVSDESGMQVVHDHDEAKQVAYSDGMEAVPKHEFFAPETVGHHEQVPRSARTKWVIGGVVGLVVIIAVVLGGVLGSRRHDSTAPGSSSTSSTTNSHPSSTPYAYQRNIAAVSTTLNSQNTTRVYYQDDTGQLFEAVEDGSTWQNNALGFSAKNGSPIAAAISRPGFPLTIDVYYVDSDNLIHDITWNAPTGPWKAGNVSSQNYTTGPNCSIAVTLDQCALCANSTLLTFQDRDNDVQVSNRTAGAWNLTPLNLGALTNTGLALVSNHEGTTIGPINLYFQKQSSKDLAQASWVPGLFDNIVNGWHSDWATDELISQAAPIAVASSYSSFPDGNVTWVNIMTVSNPGIQFNIWYGTGYWLYQNANITETTNWNSSNPKTYKAIAATSIGSAFAVVSIPGHNDSIEAFQMGDDLSPSWNSMGNVNIGTAWG